MMLQSVFQNAAALYLEMKSWDLSQGEEELLFTGQTVSMC